MSDPSQKQCDRSCPAFDMAAMLEKLGALDAGELARIEDDLDFWHFTGCASPRLRALLAGAEALRQAA